MLKYGPLLSWTPCITCISEYSKFGDCQYLDCPNDCCRTMGHPHLAIKVKCLLTLFITAMRDLACVNVVISAVPAANDAVPGTIECTWYEQV